MDGLVDLGEARSLAAAQEQGKVGCRRGGLGRLDVNGLEIGADGRRISRQMAVGSRGAAAVVECAADDDLRPRGLRLGSIVLWL